MVYRVFVGKIRGQMKHHVKRPGKYLVERSVLRNVRLKKPFVGYVGYVVSITRTQVVEDPYLTAPSGQRIDKMASDHAGTTGHKDVCTINVHGPSAR